MVYPSQAFKALATAALLSQSVIAHPTHDLTKEIAERNAFYKNSRRDLTHCKDFLHKRGIEDKQRKRRQAALEMARGKILDRDLQSVTNTSHLSDLNVTPTTVGVEEIIYSNSSCILSPEGEIGPYYVLGEYVRQNITEDQLGVPVIIDAQFINVATCEPVPNLMWDLWHANSTGVYGGVIGSSNGNPDDLSNLNNTFLRGLQLSDADGVAQFDSIFPGHYSGRATHMHVVGHLNGTILPNGTYTGGTIAHIGQLFFDQDLITEVNLLPPYVDNAIAITENVNDRVVAVEVENDADPFFNYVLLGDTVADGLFMWISMGVDTTASYSYSAAAELTSAGGVVLS
ncbi:Intradiol ring-cleavage dioxygenase [Bisporella sp. PMI_857]|nr:Intradiol ring-cleavage dioxygenase [Bisporella sp. PMI_857]